MPHVKRSQRSAASQERQRRKAAKAQELRAEKAQARGLGRRERRRLADGTNRRSVTDMIHRAAEQ